MRGIMEKQQIIKGIIMGITIFNFALWVFFISSIFLIVVVESELIDHIWQVSLTLIGTGMAIAIFARSMWPEKLGCLSRMRDIIYPWNLWKKNFW